MAPSSSEHASGVRLLDRRAEVLGRLPSRAGSQLNGFGRTLVPVLIGLAAAVLAWERIPAIARDTFWAEDGRTFVQAAIQSGPIASLFHPYAGYLHLIPRLLASFTVTFVPVPEWAQSMTMLSCIVAGVVAGVVYVCSADIVTWRPARISLSMLTVLTPLAAREVLGNAANLHSLLMWMALWILLYRPRRVGGAVALSVLIALAALTEIQIVFLLPALLYRWRDRARWIPRGAFMVAILAQVLTTLVAPRGSSHAALVDPASLAYGYLINAVLPSWMPVQGIGIVLLSWGPWLAIVLFAVCVAAAGFTFAWGRPVQRWAGVAMLGLSILIWVASVSIDPAPFYDYAGMNPSNLARPWLSRYGVVPGMLLLAEVVLGLAVVRSRLAGGAVTRRRFVPVALLAALAVCVAALSLPGVTRRSAGPTWEPQVVAAAEACEARPGRSVTLRETLGWTVTVPCALLERRSLDERRVRVPAAHGR